MSRRRPVVVLITALGAALLVTRGRLRLGAMRENMARSSMPDARSYEFTSRLFFGPVFDRIARSVAAEVPPGTDVLDVGCGPGHLAIRLARAGAGEYHLPAGGGPDEHGAHARGLRVRGADLDPAMIARAEANAERAFAPDDAARPTFVVGDVAELPFAGGTFDLVVSTFSLHHWAHPEAGLRELYRVLRPAGRALIWDVAGPLRLLENTGPGPAELAAGSPFGSLTLGGRWGFGPIVLAERYDLTRAPAEAEVAAAAEPEVVAVEPAVVAAEPEVAAGQPEAAASEPAAVAIEPAAMAAQPAAEPEMAAAIPEAIAVEPEVAAVGVMAEPEAPAGEEAPADEEAPAELEAAPAPGEASTEGVVPVGPPSTNGRSADWLPRYRGQARIWLELHRVEGSLEPRSRSVVGAATAPDITDT